MHSLETLFKKIEKKGKRSIVPVIQELVDTGRIEARSEEYKNDTPLMHAARCGHGEAVKLLLDLGANAEARSKEKETPLLIATRHYLFRKNMDVISHLIEKGAQVNAKDEDGSTALMDAAIIGDMELAKVLLNAGADPKIKNKNKTRAYDFAMWMKRTELADLLK